MIEYGIPSWYIEHCKKILYLLPKAHTVESTLATVRLAWYKIHRPEVFYKVYFDMMEVPLELITKNTDKLEEYLRNLKIQHSDDIYISDDCDEIMLVCKECLARGIRLIEE